MGIGCTGYVWVPTFHTLNLFTDRWPYQYPSHTHTHTHTSVGERNNLASLDSSRSFEVDSQESIEWRCGHWSAGESRVCAAGFVFVPGFGPLSHTLEPRPRVDTSCPEWKEWNKCTLLIHWSCNGQPIRGLYLPRHTYTHTCMYVCVCTW
jgi:hypothetical protein